MAAQCSDPRQSFNAKTWMNGVKVPKVALVVAPFTDVNLQRAAQIGVADVVVRYPSGDVRDLVVQQQRVKSFGMKITVIERALPIENAKLGVDKEAVADDIKRIKELLEMMRVADIGILCWNWMAGGDWSRTNFYEQGRGGCRFTSFDAALYKDASLQKIPEEQMWQSIDHFLKEVLPVAEKCNVKLAMHPDDPPVPNVLGMSRIMKNLEDFDKLMTKYPSPSNCICFGQGTFAEMGIDIPQTIRDFGKKYPGKIVFVHFRDVIGDVNRGYFRETWQDQGRTDMFEAMKAYVEIGFDGPMRVDHVPILAGETNDAVDQPKQLGGYTMLGRLFAVGYMKGIIECAVKLAKSK